MRPLGERRCEPLGVFVFLGKRMAFRLAQFDWMVTRFDGFTNKNNARVSTGILFRF